MTQAAPRLLLVVLFPALNLPFPLLSFMLLNTFFGAPAEFNCFCKGLALCCWKPVSCYDPGSSQASSFCTFPSLEPALPSCSVVCVWTLFGPCCFNSLFQKVWHFADGNQWAAMTQAAPRLLLFVLFPALNLPFPPVQLYVFEHFLVPAVLIACFKKFGILLMETSELLWPRQLPGFFFLYFPQPWTCPSLLFSSVSVWQLWEAH